MKKPYIYPTLKKYLEKDQEHLLLEFCENLHPVDLSSSLELAPVDEVVQLLSKFPPNFAARVLAEMNP